MFDNCWALVVEADAHSLIAIGAILRDLGVHFKRNTTGSGVVEQALQMQPKPAFVLLDLNLPHGDAFQIMAAFRSHPTLSSIPVLAIAEDNTRSLASSTRNAGFSGLLTKPLPRRNLGTLLKRMINGEQIWQPPLHPAPAR